MNPSALANPLILATSVHKTLRANVSKGSAITFDSAGNPSTFQQDNTDETMIRVGANSNPFGLNNFWAASGTDTVITHALGRVPIGYYIIKKDRPCDVYTGAGAWTAQSIVLRITDDTADTVLAIF
jgi:hypothetical protein